jgi:hypothetical protein
LGWHISTAGGKQIDHELNMKNAEKARGFALGDVA